MPPGRPIACRLGLASRFVICGRPVVPSRTTTGSIRAYLANRMIPGMRNTTKPRRITTR